MFIGFSILSSCSLSNSTRSKPSSTTNRLPDKLQLTVVGTIQRLNLPAKLVAQNNWQNVQYLLQEFPAENSQPVYYAIFSNQSQPLGQYLNLCVQISAISLDQKRIPDSPYSQLVPIQLSNLKISNHCKSNHEPLGKTYQQNVILKGQINSQFRPTFNLPYDYFFISHKSFVITLLNGQKQNITQIIATPETDQARQQINQSLKRDVTITGSLILGENDTQILQINSVLLSP